MPRVSVSGQGSSRNLHGTGSPPGQTSCPGSNFSVPCSGNRTRGEGILSFSLLQTVLPEIEADAVHRPDGCNADLPFLLPRQLITLPFFLGELL